MGRELGRLTSSLNRDFVPPRRGIPVMDLDLVGYALGILSPLETERVTEAVRHDPQLQRELDRIRQTLTRLSDGAAETEMPAHDLIEQTLDQIPDGLPPTFAEPARTDEAEPLASETSRELATNPGDGVSVPTMPLRGMTPSSSPPGSRSMSAMNAAALVTAAAVVLAISFPVVSRWRAAARRMACQDQMRSIGTAITQFVLRDPQNRLPAIAPSGAEAFAGMYAVHLADAGLMEEQRWRWCPESDLPAALAHEDWNPRRLPTATEVRSAAVPTLAAMQRHAGGHYGYTLGVRDRTHYHAPRYESRPTFAVLADLPMTLSQHDDRLGVQSSHGDGINVLFEDNSVRFVSLVALPSLPDPPLQNHLGLSEAGVTLDDASLGPSWRAPFRDSPQR